MSLNKSFIQKMWRGHLAISEVKKDKEWRVEKRETIPEHRYTNSAIKDNIESWTSLISYTPFKIYSCIFHPKSTDSRPPRARTVKVWIYYVKYINPTKSRDCINTDEMLKDNTLWGEKKRQNKGKTKAKKAQNLALVRNFCVFYSRAVVNYSSGEMGYRRR